MLHLQEVLCCLKLQQREMFVLGSLALISGFASPSSPLTSGLVPLPLPLPARPAMGAPSDKSFCGLLLHWKTLKPSPLEGKQSRVLN